MERKIFILLAIYLLVSFIPSSSAVTQCLTGTFDSQLTNQNPIQSEKCSPDSLKYIFCTKEIYTGNGRSLIRKGCSDACEEKHFSGDGVEFIITCCRGENCNFSASVLSNKILTGFGISIAIFLSLSF